MTLDHLLSMLLLPHLFAAPRAWVVWVYTLPRYTANELGSMHMAAGWPKPASLLALAAIHCRHGLYTQGLKKCRGIALDGPYLAATQH